MASPTSLTLRVRIPKWTNLASAAVNGKAADGVVKDHYLSMDREWTSGDTLTVVFPMTMRVEADMTGRGPRSGAVSIDGKSDEAKRLAVFYGPVVAAMFRTGHGNDLNWVWTGDYTDTLDSGGDAGSGYPASKADTLELNGQSFDSGTVPAMTSVRSEGSVPELSWTADMNGKIQLKYSVKVLPGLPVTIESREDVLGWDGQGRLLCSGVRFATVKDASSDNYGVCSVPYPLPCVTTKPDLDNHVVYAGIYGLFERLANDASLAKTGAYYLNNGYFGAICLYDQTTVQSVVCRQTNMYTGLYLEPTQGSDVTLVRRLVFPLSDRPQNQTSAKQRMEAAAQVTAQLIDDSRRLVLSGPVLEGAPITVPKSLGLQAGWVIHNDKLASNLLDYDTESLMVYADVPGTYDVKRP